MLIISASEAQTLKDLIRSNCSKKASFHSIIQLIELQIGKTSVYEETRTFLV